MILIKQKLIKDKINPKQNDCHQRSIPQKTQIFKEIEIGVKKQQHKQPKVSFNNFCKYAVNYFLVEEYTISLKSVMYNILLFSNFNKKIG